MPERIKLTARAIVWRVVMALVAVWLIYFMLRAYVL